MQQSTQKAGFRNKRRALFKQKLSDTQKTRIQVNQNWVKWTKSSRNTEGFNKVQTKAKYKKHITGKHWRYRGWETQGGILREHVMN